MQRLVPSAIRLTLRSLLRNRGFTAMTVLTLGLGIGAITLVYSVVYGVLVRPLPYTEPDRLVNVWNHLVNERQDLPAVHPGDFRDYERMSTSFEEFAAASGANMAGLAGVLTGEGPALHVEISTITYDFFPLLGVEMDLGRPFTPEEEAYGGPRVAIISHDLWRDRYGSDPGMIGESIELDGSAFQVVGVLPRHFRLQLPREAFLVRHADVWVPLQYDYSSAPPRNWTFFTVFGRMKPGVSLEQAQTDMDRVAGVLRSEHPVHVQSGMEIRLQPLQQDVVKEARPALLVLFGAVAFVLLISAANAAHLLLVRSGTREKDLAVRAAMGADGRLLVKETLQESLILALGGAVLGLLIAYGGLEIIQAVQPPNLPRLAELSIDGWVLLFCLGVTVLTALLFGAAAAWKVHGTEVAPLLREGARGGVSRGTHRFRNMVVVTEIAFSLVLLVGTGLMVRTFHALQEIRPGFEPKGAMTFLLSLPAQRYTPPDRIAFVEELEDQLTGLPGVESAGASSQLPLTGTVPLWPYTADGADPMKSTLSADGRIVTPDYFRAQGTRLLSGRFFTRDDRGGRPPVIIVDELFARKVWPGEEAVGKELRLGLGGPLPPMEVVGVVEHPRVYDLTRDVREQVYLPHAQSAAPAMGFVVRSSEDPTALAGPIRRVVADLDPALPVQSLRPLSAYTDDAMAQPRFLAGLLTAFGLLALVLACIGTYGVMAYTVELRTREFAVRMVLGAGPRDVMSRVLARGGRLLAAGMAVGIAAALLLSNTLSGMLYGVAAWDPLTYVTFVLVLGAAGLAALFVPALRATRGHPVQALNAE